MSLSPMMKQYFKTKEENPGILLLYRLGDFYEMFYDDALKASELLDITLTSRDCGLPQRAPMCGVPYHAVDNYIAKLVAAGIKVGLCEQTSPSDDGKGIMRRELVRIFTPGTLVESSILDENRNNYLLSVYGEVNGIGVAWVDVSTGEFEMEQCIGENSLIWLTEKLETINPAEIISNQSVHRLSRDFNAVKQGRVVAFGIYGEHNFDESKGREIIRGTFRSSEWELFDKHPLALCAAGALMNYVTENGKRNLTHISSVKKEPQKFLMLDFATRRNLELTETIRGQTSKNRALLGLLNRTNTAMGSRRMRGILERPLADANVINARLDGVEELVKSAVLRENISLVLKRIQDIHRIAGKISYDNANPRELTALSNSLEQTASLKKLLNTVQANILQEINSEIADFTDITTLLNSAIIQEPPAVLNGGGFIREGYDTELDEYVKISKTGKEILNELEVKEKELTGIKSLKIRFNRVFGYFIEIPHSQTENIPLRYVRKQTTANAERYITDELKVLEEKILGAETLSVTLEQQLFDEIIKKLQDNIERILNAAGGIALLDVLCALASVAVCRRYVKPEINENVPELSIIEGRHPVVEINMSEGEFVPNDTRLDNSQNKIMIITGPNMAGKSTYMRQVALIALLAHIGSFVPAKRASIPVCDRIFTRIGASDDLSAGQSTFMVEMTEVAEILSKATGRSLIIMDEVGRGTSTLDGLSIAWAILEYLSRNSDASTLFSTHYHELTELEGALPGVKNYRISVREFDNTIIFLHKIIRGGANRSFGIEVGQMAGLPEAVTKRAKEILKNLEKTDINRHKDKPSENSVQLSLFASRETGEIISILKDINIETLSPLKAFDIVQNLVEKASKLQF